MTRLARAVLIHLRGQRRIVVAVALAVVAVLLVVFRPAQAPAPQAEQDAATPTASASTTMSTSPSPRPSRSPRPSPAPETGQDHDHSLNYSPAPQTTTAAPAASQVATDFARGWVQGRLPADRWWAALAPLCESGFAAALRGTDPANVPARQVTGPAKSTQSSGDLATFLVPTDAGDLQVTVAHLRGGWKVTDNDWRPR